MCLVRHRTGSTSLSLYAMLGACSDVEDFNDRNKVITSKLIRQGYRFHKLRRTFSKFYQRNGNLDEKYNSNTKALMQNRICPGDPQCYGKIKGRRLFPDKFKTIIRKYINRKYDPPFTAYCWVSL